MNKILALLLISLALQACSWGEIVVRESKTRQAQSQGAIVPVSTKPAS